MTTSLDLAAWLRQVCANYCFDVAGILQTDSVRAEWPVTATDPDDLRQKLDERGHLLPLPREPAALANVLEVSIVDFLTTQAAMQAGVELQRGNERSYPDIEFSGSAFGGTYHAVDVKVARRAQNGRRTQSRITLYTGNTYFKHPDLHWPGVPRPFAEYASHLDVIMIYTLNKESHSRVEDLEIIVQEPWRIGSRERSSTTREYIGAVNDLDALRNGRGVFETSNEFYTFWRRYHFKISAQVQTQYEKALAKTQEELAALRARHDGQS